MSISLKVHRFIEANRKSPVVYGSVDAHLCTYRLADGSTWVLPRREARAIGHPAWAHMPISTDQSRKIDRPTSDKLFEAA